MEEGLEGRVSPSPFAQTFLGIDPGKTGALALYDSASGALEVEDVPVFRVKGRATVDHYGLARIIDAWSPRNPTVFLELVGSRPGEGHAGAFDFGRTYGLILGVCAASFLRIELVTPATWKTALKVRGDKDVSRQRASALLPHYGHIWTRKKDDGRAEAALIAVYGSQSRRAP